MQTLAASFHGNLHKTPYSLGSSCQIGRAHRGPDRLGPRKGGRACRKEARQAKSWCCSFDTLLHPHTTTRNAPPHSATVQYPFCPSRLARPSPSFSAVSCTLRHGGESPVRVCHPNWHHQNLATADRRATPPTDLANLLVGGWPRLGRKERAARARVEQGIGDGEPTGCNGQLNSRSIHSDDQGFKASNNMCSFRCRSLKVSSPVD